MSASSAPPPRRNRGFEAASGLLKARIRAAGESRGFAVMTLLTHWSEVVGEEVASIALPVKIGYARDGFGATLTLLTTGAAAPILQMQLPKIRDKVNACYGYSAISRITITQTAPVGFAEGQVAFRPAPKAVAEPDPAIRQDAETAAAGIRDTELRRALAALGEKVLSRPATRKG